MEAQTRIVVADDEPDMRDYFRMMLPRMGYSLVGVAEDGLQLIEICEREKPDLIITDVKMPGMDGIEATVKILSERPVPIIVVSAFADAETVKRAESLHFLGFLVKPIKQADLEPAISLALQRFSQIQSLRREKDSGTGNVPQTPL